MNTVLHSVYLGFWMNVCNFDCCYIIIIYYQIELLFLVSVNFFTIKLDSSSGSVTFTFWDEVSQAAAMTRHAWLHLKKAKMLAWIDFCVKVCPFLLHEMQWRKISLHSVLGPAQCVRLIWTQGKVFSSVYKRHVKQTWQDEKQCF